MAIKVGGGGGSIVGDLKPLYVTDASGLYVNGSEEWLKTGVIETNAGVYPDAKKTTTAAGVYTSISFSVAGQDSSPQGITWDGSGFWVLGNSTDFVYKYFGENIIFVGLALQSLDTDTTLPIYLRIK